MPLLIIRAVLRDITGLREMVENIARGIWTLTPSESIMGDLQRALKTCYRAVAIAEHVSGYLNKSFSDSFGTVLDFANGGQREFLSDTAARRFRELRRVG